MGKRRVGRRGHRPMEDGEVLMRIKKTRKSDPEIPSTVLAKVIGTERMYWTGSDWTDDMKKAKKYPREEALTKSVKKKAFVVTTGFRTDQQ